MLRAFVRATLSRKARIVSMIPRGAVRLATVAISARAGMIDTPVYRLRWPLSGIPYPSSQRRQMHISIPFLHRLCTAHSYNASGSGLFRSFLRPRSVSHIGDHLWRRTFDLWYLLCQKFSTGTSTDPIWAGKRCGLCKSGSALSTVSAGCVLEAAIWTQGRKTGPSISTSVYRMQNLDGAEPIGSLNKPLTYSLLVRQPHVELQTGLRASHSGNR